MLIQSIQLTNFLSFGASSATIPLGPLNVIIGPNGSGKSNLLESIELLRSAPEQLLKPIREGGGVRDWLWKGAKGTPTASLDVLLTHPKGPQNLRYHLAFTEVGQRFEIADERVENEAPDGPKHPQPYFFYHFNKGRPVLNLKGGGARSLRQEDVDLEKSILSQRRDPDQYPEVTYLGQTLGKIRLYREWSFGRYTAPRLPQKADLPNDVLESDSSNLGLVLNRLRRDPAVKQRLLTALQVLYSGIDDYDVQIEGGTVQVFFHEGGYTIPATRLSDGTLRYLCLLAVLCHPNPPPLICIEEPELGLHPDILPTLAQLLKDAATRTQLIVTTHSDVLIDAMSDQPESVLVADKTDVGTTLTRLNAEKLKPWLEKYRLGQLWTRGEIGGTRW
ncbi:AAA family ATPase [Pseudomonas mediterranea]|uniref:Predicted ATPase n=1 Tax=Pseudomonas mediterranea TaxID=183795 RepID=A0AAX2DBI8_9PSED|nr:AAA family ATPase [Pseudomonas mediterranea]KGU85965.1 chromosome segregation protein SMC [Pseudomonas mediterranea CFBP 5447]MBL0843039.1 AAA family ATPase [Pseudomonas mediterranea]MDU9028757.1 AAA family ATPase [Pseudomonas mediterranea]QHA83442.1 AAA family ATPase [Pseudomonas mediterranea]UZD99273.1 AAA family ATPase [Pseudomonas mediterranea]